MYKAEIRNSKIKREAILSDAKGESYVIIDLDHGARVRDYTCKKISIISGLDDSVYNEGYESAILFPFANRIEKGKYVYKNKTFQLVCNEVQNHNAIHGLVHDKPFEIINTSIFKESSSIELSYTERTGQDGFPFQYTLTLRYELSSDALSLTLKVKNEDEHAFPYTMGWHPYFNSSNLAQSQLLFSAHKEFVNNEMGIPITSIEFTRNMPFKLDQIELDHAFALDSDKVNFYTPEYQLTINGFDDEDNYLQVFTPKSPGKIAIEPMTGISNSFNNKIGLKILKPNDEIQKEWILKLKIL